MGLGNSGQNANSGNKGSGWRYEFNVLKALDQIATNTMDITVDIENLTVSTDDLEILIGDTNTLLTTLSTTLSLETTQLDILAALAQGTISSPLSSPYAASGANVVFKPGQTPTRTEISIRNNGTGILYVTKGAVANVNTPYKLFTDEVVIITNYDGPVSGIWSPVGIGNAQVEETTTV